MAKMKSSPTVMLTVLISKFNEAGGLDSNVFKIGEKMQNISRASPHDPFYMEILWLISDRVNPCVHNVLENKRF